MNCEGTRSTPPRETRPASPASQAGPRRADPSLRHLGYRAPGHPVSRCCACVARTARANAEPRLAAHRRALRHSGASGMAGTWLSGAVVLPGTNRSSRRDQVARRYAGSPHHSRRVARHLGRATGYTGASTSRWGEWAGDWWSHKSARRSDCSAATAGSFQRLTCCKGSSARWYSSPSVPSCT